MKESINFPYPALSLPAASNVQPSSDTAIEVTVELCALRVDTHFFAKRSQTRTAPSSLPENNFTWREKGERQNKIH